MQCVNPTQSRNLSLAAAIRDLLRQQTQHILERGNHGQSTPVLNDFDLTFEAEPRKTPSEFR